MSAKNINNQENIAAFTLKKEMPIEIRKRRGIAKLLKKECFPVGG